MSTLSDHRTIIAALFLPTSTAAPYHPDQSSISTPSSPATEAIRRSVFGYRDSPPKALKPPPQSPPKSKLSTSQISRPTHPGRSSSLSQLSQVSPETTSIIDDLLSEQAKRRAKATSPGPVPRGEKNNPFASFAASGSAGGNGKRLGGINELKALDLSFKTPESQPSSRNSSDSEMEVRGRIPWEKRKKSLRRHESPSQETGGTALYRRLSRKQSKGSVSMALTREVSLGPWEIETNPNANGGLHNAVKSIEPEMKSGKVWVGVLGPETDDISPSMRTEIESRMKERDSIPIWIKDSDFTGCYDTFCHQVLWPSLHYIIPDAPRTKVLYDSNSFIQYKAVNEAFADKIVSIYKEGDVISNPRPDMRRHVSVENLGVNDYHLLLLPQLLRARLPKAAIGFFMHVAFPSSEIFRCLAARESLLRGMLGADLVGFQTHSYARHFRQTVSRVLGIEATPKGIQLASGQHTRPEISSVLINSNNNHVTEAKEEKEEMSHGHHKTDLEIAVDDLKKDDTSEHRFADVAVFPMGIDVQSLTRKRREREVDEWVRALKERYKGMKMIVARDKLDEVQGVRQKFLAYERFLEQNKDFQGKVMLIQVALSTSTINELHGNVVDVIARINMKFSSLTYQPIVFFQTQDLTFSQYLALLTIADCFIVTSMREGMALRTHEFVECQSERKRPLILSEFTGSWSFTGFRSCLAINPWDIQMTADAIRQSLTMSQEEAEARWADLHSHVNTQTAQAFATSFLNRTIRVNYKHHIKDSLLIPPIDPIAFRERYHGLTRPESKRLILIDLEGTLWPLDMHPHSNVEARSDVSEKTIQLLERLVADEKNEVWGLSGLAVKGRLEQIARKVPMLGLCAEYGCFMKPRGSSEWVNMIPNLRLDWMDPCMEILQYFTERTPSSSIDKRQATVVWRYEAGDDEADRSWTRRQAAEAQNHIYDSLGERFGLRIIPTFSSFIVMPKVVGRTMAVGAILTTTNIPDTSNNAYSANPSNIPNSPNTPYTAGFTGFTSMPSLSALSAAIEQNTDLTAIAPAWPSPNPDGDGGIASGYYELILAVSSDESLMSRLKKADNAVTVYTGARKSGGSKWRCEPEDIYRAFDDVLRK